MGCDWWIKRINVSGMTVNFHISIAGNNWTIYLKNANGAIEDQKSGSSYGDHSLTAKTGGAHTLELNCGWNTSNPCEVCPVDIGAAGTTAPPTTATPPAASPPAGTSSSYWKDKDTYVGYYTCADPTYKCPDESSAPGWKIISKKSAGMGTYGGCSGCLMTEIIWQRITTTAPAPTGCKEGTTRTVKCPQNGRDVLQKCVNGTWVNVDRKACEGNKTVIFLIAAVVLIMVLRIFMARK